MISSPPLTERSTATTDRRARARRMAELPRELAEGVARLLERVSGRDRSRPRSDLSAKYRQKVERRGPVARSPAEIVAYAATRLPATYAAISAVFGAVRELRPDWRPRTLLDL